MRQIPLSQIQIGDWKYIAMVSLSPDEIEQKLGVKFEDDHDDLDHYKGCLLDVDGQQLYLTRYRGEPGQGTTIKGFADLHTEALQLLITLKSGPCNILWMSPQYWNCRDL